MNQRSAFSVINSQNLCQYVQSIKSPTIPQDWSLINIYRQRGQWDCQGLDTAIDPLPRNLTIPNGKHGLKEKKSIGAFNEIKLIRLASRILIPTQNVQLCISS